MSETNYPENWKIVPLRELARARMGKTILKKDLTETGVPVYSAGASTEPWGFLEGSDVSFGLNTLVISARGNIGSPKRPRFAPFVCTQTTIACSAYVADTVGWLHWFLTQFDYSTKSSQTTIPMLRTSDVDSFAVPLPPLAEQRRIVAKIEELFSELDAGEESLRRARRQLGVYRQSLLKQAFEGKLTAPWRKQNPHLLESSEQLLARIQTERKARYMEDLKSWEETGRRGSKPQKPTSIRPFSTADLVGDPVVPDEWLVMTYGDLCSLVRNGISLKPSGTTGHKIARISAVRPMAFDLQDYRFLDCAMTSLQIIRLLPVISFSLVTTEPVASSEFAPVSPPPSHDSIPTS